MRKQSRKNQKSLTCSQCLQFKHVKCPGRKAQNNLQIKPTTTADWTCSFCDFSFPFASCSEVEFDDIFNPTDSCYDKTLNAHDLNLMFNNTINSDNTSINDTDNDIILEEDDSFTINSKTQYVTTNLVKKYLIHDSSSHFNFTAISVNIRSLNNYKNFSKLESLLSALTFTPSIIAVTETWLKPDQLGPHTNLSNYTFLSNPRSKYRGGGVAFYIRDGIEFTHRIDLDIMNEKIFESIFVDIKFQDKVITCGNIYHSPCNNGNAQKMFLADLDNILRKINKRESFLFGDFNYNILDCDEPNVTKFIDVMYDHGFSSLINRPTRITDNSSTLLDQIWTNSNTLQKVKSCIITFSISDHLATMMSIAVKKCKSSKSGSEYYRQFSDSKIESFSKSLSELDITPVLNETDPNKAYNKFYQDYRNKFEEHFPLKKRLSRLKPQKRWFDQELKNLLQCKEKLLKQYMTNKTSRTKALFTQARNLYYRAVKEKKQAFYKNKFQMHKCDIKGTWRYINSLLGKRSKSNGITLLINGTEVNDPQLVANHFNDHFSTAAKKLVDTLPSSNTIFSEYLSISSLPSMYVWPTCPSEISNIILKLKNKLSAGLDLVPTKVLKASPDNILVALSHVFNLSLSKGEFINDFKIAKVCPVFKKGNAKDINNYRPISLLSNVSKILEKIMYSRLYSFLERHHFFFQQQFGFRKNHGTSHALSFLIHNITESLANKTPTLGVFLDLSKAFDTIDHSILLSKLEHSGIRGIALDWIKSYLSGRTQKVECSGILSKSVNPVKRGVPQGSNLGPLLFLIYVNDFKNCLKYGNSIMFADDTSVFFQNKNYHSLYANAQQDLQNIDQWMIANKLSINASKTKCMLFRSTKSKTPPSDQSISLRKLDIEQVSSLKFLGVHIDEHLTWSVHAKHVLNKLRSGLAAARRVKPFLNQGTLITLYHSLMGSHLQYYISSWYYGNTTITNKLQKLCDKFIRLACGRNRNSDITDIRQKYEILTIDQLLFKDIAVFMFKQNKNKNPSVFSKIFVTNHSQYNTRNNSKIIPKFCSTNVCQQSISHRGPSLWSKVPTFYKSQDLTIASFNLKMRNILCKDLIQV